MSKTQESWRNSRTAIKLRAKSAIHTLAVTNVFLLKRVWAWPIAAAILLGFGGWFLRGAVETTLREDRRANLQAILDAEVTALRIWLRSEEAIVRGVAADPPVKAAIATLRETVSQEGLSKGELLSSPALERLRLELQPHLEAHQYDGFLVIDPGFNVIAAMRDDPIGINVEDESSRLFFELLSQRAVLVTRPRKSQIVLPDKSGTLRAGTPTMFTFAALFQEDGSLAAALGLRIRPEDEFTEILRVAQAGESGETYAFDRDGLLLSKSRHEGDLRQIGLLTEDADSILNVSVRDPGVDLTSDERTATPRSQQPLTRMAQSAVSGESGIDVDGYRDYRGVRVIGAWTWLDDYGFGVATEIERSEAFRSLTLIRIANWSLMGLLLAAAIAIFAFTVMVARLNVEARRAALEAKRLGQYTLDQKLGEGGMGVVYRAHHDMLHRPTAVKFLHVDRVDENALARFEREVRMTSELTHPNTIAIYDYGRTAEGIFYYAMEYLDGIDLEQLVEQFGPQPDGRVLPILRQMCGSLAEAHEIGLIHRDIKPANVMLNARGGLFDFVKLLDFGLVKSVDSTTQAAVTGGGGLVGTPLYLSPEAIAGGGQVDARSDLYAVGAVGYYLLTGKPIFDTTNLLEILRQHRETKPEAMSQRLGRPVAPDVEALIQQCLAKDPLERPPTARQLAQQLTSCQVLRPWNEHEAEAWWTSYQAERQAPNAESIVAGESFAATIVKDIVLDK